MKVNGIEITSQQIEGMNSALSERFRCSDLIAAGIAAGISETVASRAADRQIQKLRKAGKIKIIDSGPYWTLA